MSATTSAATGRCFGIQRVCQVWERSRSALYARRARAHHRLGAGPARRGPPPRQSDAQLLAAIRTDLARSPFHGEGHRKVHARLRILDGIRVARTRVLRVMRAHGLLSPHRGRQGAAKTHDGRVITQAPNVMWGTDGVRVFTLDDGWGWIFAAVEHWNAECVGWHVCKVGSRFAALDPIAQGLERVRLEFPILSLNAGRRQRCVPPIVCPTLSRVWKLSCSPCSTWPSRPQSSVGPAACEP